MKKTYILGFVFILGFVAVSLADDGIKQQIKKIQMNINPENYLLFEEGNLVICSRENDSYLMEVDEEGNLFISARKIALSGPEKEYLRGYYRRMYEIFDLRNSLGSKGVRVGLAGARLAVKAVGHAVQYVFSGFDEEVEKKMECELEREAEKLEDSTDGMESQGNRLAQRINEINRYIEKELRPHVPAVRKIALELDEDTMPRISISSDDEE